MDYSNQEVQKDGSNYSITLLSNEIILLPCIINEDIDEERDGLILLNLESGTYNQRLYEAFKNKELIQFIRKESVHATISDRTLINRAFTYDCYFKIEEFRTRFNSRSTATYDITLKSI